jgi:hypothetical protein
MTTVADSGRVLIVTLPDCSAASAGRSRNRAAAANATAVTMPADAPKRQARRRRERLALILSSETKARSAARSACRWRRTARAACAARIRASHDAFLSGASREFRVAAAFGASPVAWSVEDRGDCICTPLALESGASGTCPTFGLETIRRSQIRAAGDVENCNEWKRRSDRGRPLCRSVSGLLGAESTDFHIPSHQKVSVWPRSGVLFPLQSCRRRLRS